MSLYRTLLLLAVGFPFAVVHADHSAAPAAADPALAAVVAGEWRSADDKARDQTAIRSPHSASGASRRG